MRGHIFVRDAAAGSPQNTALHIFCTRVMPEGFLYGPVVLVLSYELLVEHRCQHHCPPLFGFLRISEGRIHRRRLRQSCKEGSLSDRELIGVFSEIGLGSSFYAEGPCAEIGLVQIKAEYLIFCIAFLYLYRDDRFFDLPD